MKDVAQITKRGNSLGVSITSTCKAMGLEEGDMVSITVEKIDHEKNKIVKRSPTGELYRIYAANGTIEAEFDNLEDALALACSHCKDNPDLIETVFLANREYDTPDYNPQTGEEYDGVLNEEEKIIGDVYFDGVELYIFNPESSDLGFEVLPDGKIGVAMYCY